MVNELGQCRVHGSPGDWEGGMDNGQSIVNRANQKQVRVSCSGTMIP